MRSSPWICVYGTFLLPDWEVVGVDLQPVGTADDGAIVVGVGHILKNLVLRTHEYAASRGGGSRLAPRCG